MRPRLTVLTLAVGDLDRAVAFYRDGLGWPTKGILGAEIENGAVAFFKLENGLAFGLWPKASLVAEAGLEDEGPQGSASFSLGYNVDSKEEVDEAMASALEAGGTVLKQAADRDWGGYSGYFRDPDGHLWEVVWNPGFAELT
ncbi:VOC family protein [bacterium]|nr:MAG: VOC family protein [bacterium]